MPEIIKLKLVKVGLAVWLEIKVQPEIEQYFHDLTIAEFGDNEESIQVSSKWFDKKNQGLKFYRINIAPLRIVGASEGVTMETNGLLPIDDMEDYLNSFSQASLEFYNNYFLKQELKAKINFEII